MPGYIYHNSDRVFFKSTSSFPQRKSFHGLFRFPEKVKNRLENSPSIKTNTGENICRKCTFLPYLVLIFVFGIFTGCDLEKEIQIDLPDFENGYVVESYLSPDNDFGLLLTKSYGFFEVFDSNLLDPDHLMDILVQGADGYIEVNGKRHLLVNKIKVAPEVRAIFNYTLSKKVRFKENDQIALVLKLPTGEQVTASTRIPVKRPLDSMRLVINEDKEAREISFLYTDTVVTEYFRRQLLRIRDGRMKAIQDYIIDNETAKGGKLAFGSGFEFVVGDTIISRVIHIDKEYFDFFQSVTGSVSANSNPFGQPGNIESNIRGSNHVIGIFTGINQSQIFQKISN